MLRLRLSVIFFAAIYSANPLFCQNDKQVLGNPVMTPEQIESGQPILYLIRFQNIWLDTVRQVVIRDTLDPRLDPTSFVTLDASHDYQLLGEGGSEIRWYFEGIQLPDSTTGGSNSVGYVLFSVRPRAFLTPGQTIVNRACIFFDDTLSVCTNEAIVLIDEGSDVSEAPIAKNDFKVVPNPNYGQFEVHQDSKPATHVDHNAVYWVTDMNGRTIWNHPAHDVSANSSQIWLEKPSPGLYLLWVKSEKHLQIERFTIVSP